MSPNAIMDEISRCTNTQFDPKVVDAFDRVLAKNGQSVIVNSARNVKPREKSVWLSDYSIQDGVPFPPD
jgi:HD-GYP domain-containing protein (c-di-GMP phosphodiesterase class II)